MSLQEDQRRLNEALSELGWALARAIYLDRLVAWLSRKLGS